jgi:hypothetical protein
MFDGSYFLVPPEVAILTHYPTAHGYQHLTRMCQRREFDRSPLLYPMFFSCKFALESHRDSAALITTTEPALTVTFLCDEWTPVMLAVLVQPGTTEADTWLDRRVLPSWEQASDTQARHAVMVRFPSPGLYELHVYVAPCGADGSGVNFFGGFSNRRGQPGCGLRLAAVLPLQCHASADVCAAQPGFPDRSAYACSRVVLDAPLADVLAAGTEHEVIVRTRRTGVKACIQQGKRAAQQLRRLPGASGVVFQGRVHIAADASEEVVLIVQHVDTELLPTYRFRAGPVG